MNVGFIGVGYMGYGIAKNILKKGNDLFVIANKKRAPIDKIVSDGAIEVKSYNELCEKNLDFSEKFTFNNDSNKFALSQYRKTIEQNLINNIYEKLIIRMQTL